MTDGFARRLARTLSSTFSVDVPIVESEDGAGPRIVARVTGSGGDPYAGGHVWGEVKLRDFVRPDTRAPVVVDMTWMQHDLSGQMDDWHVDVRGLTRAELDAWRDVFEPGAYDDFHLGNYISWSVKLDGAYVVRVERGSPA